MPRSPSLLLAVPVGQDRVTTQLLHGVLALQRRFADLGWDLEVRTRTDALVCRSRNEFASDVVQDDGFTHLLMLDDDIGLAPAAIERLVSSGHDVCGACVPLRQVRWDWARAALDREPSLTAEELRALSHRFAVSFDTGGRTSLTPAEGFLPARYLGGAAMLIRRSALLRLADSDLVAPYRRTDPPGRGWAFFDPLVDPEFGTYLSEDYAFCWRWRRLGGRVWADVRSPVAHRGPVNIQGDAGATLRAARRGGRGRAATPPS